MAADFTDEDVPEPGDVSICFSCIAIAMYDVHPLLGTLVLRPPTDEERAEVESDPQFAEVRHAMAESYTGDQAAQLYQGGQS